MSGKLYLVSLPIGNLEVISLRAIRTLREVDLVVAEDTRTTRRIFARYRIRTPFSQSLYQGVEKERVEPILSLLQEGKDLALVSDAGTPLVCDPGYPLVRATVKAGISVVPVPGPTAAIAALVASGLPPDRFAFDGAVPRKERERVSYFASLRNQTKTTVLYESPHRLLGTLAAIASTLPDRKLVLARELTKVHEEFLRGTARDLLETPSLREGVKGELVLLIEGARTETPRADQAVRREELLEILEEEGIAKGARVRILVGALGLPRNEAYRLVHRV